MKREGGFTLLEVLAAFMIMALTFAVTMQSITGGLTSTRKASILTQAALLAKSKLDEVGRLEPLELGSAEGDFNDQYRWFLEVREGPIQSEGSDLSEDSFPVALREVSLTVSWDVSGVRGEETFTTLRAVTRE